jgi:hypothetical protein
LEFMILSLPVVVVIPDVGWLYAFNTVESILGILFRREVTSFARVGPALTAPVAQVVTSTRKLNVQLHVGAAVHAGASPKSLEFARKCHLLLLFVFQLAAEWVRSPSVCRTFNKYITGVQNPSRAMAATDILIWMRVVPRSDYFLDQLCFPHSVFSNVPKSEKFAFPPKNFSSQYSQINLTSCPCRSISTIALRGAASSTPQISQGIGTLIFILLWPIYK